MRNHVVWLVWGSALVACAGMAKAPVTASVAAPPVAQPVAQPVAPPPPAPPPAPPAAPPAASVQSVLGPGLYVYQTRTRGSLCGDSERDGYVMSFLAAIEGVPGSTTMKMELVNTQHFKTWSLNVADNAELSGKSRMGASATAPDAQFTVTREDDRWKGTGFRTYQGKKDGQSVRCRVDFDALLRRIDTRLRVEAEE